MIALLFFTLHMCAACGAIASDADKMRFHAVKAVAKLLEPAPHKAELFDRW
jgi:hypothetical protein